MNSLGATVRGQRKASAGGKGGLMSLIFGSPRPSPMPSGISSASRLVVVRTSKGQPNGAEGQSEPVIRHRKKAGELINYER